MKKVLLAVAIFGLAVSSQAQLFNIDSADAESAQNTETKVGFEAVAEKPDSAVVAGSATVFEQYIEATQDLQGDFTQTVYSNNSIDISNGKMWISKPGKFYWDYQTPMAQKIISNGTKVWQYDLDLEQISVRGRDELVGDVAMNILTGTRHVNEFFRVSSATFEQIPVSLKSYVQGAEIYQLTPLNEQDGYDLVWVMMKNNALYGMSVDGGNGQQTVLIFNNLKRNVGIPASQFEFTPPKGVDVIGE